MDQHNAFCYVPYPNPNPILNPIPIIFEWPVAVQTVETSRPTGKQTNKPTGLGLLFFQRGRGFKDKEHLALMFLTYLRFITKVVVNKSKLMGKHTDSDSQDSQDSKDSGSPTFGP